jgi:hypothetical protein
MGTVMRVSLGADIGKKTDPTAIVVVEHDERHGRMHYVARHVERLELGLPYPQIADRIAEVAKTLRIWSKGGTFGGNPVGVDVYVDATGVGTPVVDLLDDRGIRPIPVYFTGTDKRIRHSDGSVAMGKAWLVGRLQVLFQANRIHLPNTPEAKALVKELLAYEVRVTPAANLAAGVFRNGEHDDLVTALALAVGSESDRPGRVTDSSVFAPAADQHHRNWVQRQERRRAAGR